MPLPINHLLRHLLATYKPRRRTVGAQLPYDEVRIPDTRVYTYHREAFTFRNQQYQE